MRSILRPLLVAVWLAATAHLLLACSLFGPRMQTLTISSAPPDAVVVVNGNTAGRTPTRHQVHRNTDVLIEVRKEGYRTEYRNTHQTLSTLGILDVIGGVLILVPFVGLFSGAAWKQEPSTFGVHMERDSES